MIQALSPERADDPLGDSIRPWRTDGREHRVDPQALGLPHEVAPGDPIRVANEEAGPASPRRGVDELSPGVRYAHAGFALALPHAGGEEDPGGVVLVDPPALTDEHCAQLEGLGAPTHVLLTCEWHTRRAAWCRERWNCRGLMHGAGMARAEIPVDGVLEDGALLWDAVRVVRLRGVYYPEEVALLVACARPEPFLILGDALSGGRADEGIPDGARLALTPVGAAIRRGRLRARHADPVRRARRGGAVRLVRGGVARQRRSRGDSGACGPMARAQGADALRSGHRGAGAGRPCPFT